MRVNGFLRNLILTSTMCGFIHSTLYIVAFAESNKKEKLAQSLPYSLNLNQSVKQSSQIKSHLFNKQNNKQDIEKQISNLVHSPNNIVVKRHLQKGLYLKQQGKDEEALFEFIMAARENPRQIKAFYEQSLLFKKLGNTKLATSALEQALAISPNYTEARSLLVQLHFESGNLLGAATEVGRLMGISPKNNLNSASKKKPTMLIEMAKDAEKTASSATSAALSLPPPTNMTQSQLMTSIEEKTNSWLDEAAKPNIAESPKAEQPKTDLNKEQDKEIPALAQALQSVPSPHDMGNNSNSLGIKNSTLVEPVQENKLFSAKDKKLPNKLSVNIFQNLKVHTNQVVSTLKTQSTSLNPLKSLREHLPSLRNREITNKEKDIQQKDIQPKNIQAEDDSILAWVKGHVKNFGLPEIKSRAALPPQAFSASEVEHENKRHFTAIAQGLQHCLPFVSKKGETSQISGLAKNVDKNAVDAAVRKALSQANSLPQKSQSEIQKQNSELTQTNQAIAKMIDSNKLENISSIKEAEIIKPRLPISSTQDTKSVQNIQNLSAEVKEVANILSKIQSAPSRETDSEGHPIPRYGLLADNAMKHVNIVASTNLAKKEDHNKSIKQDENSIMANMNKIFSQATHNLVSFVPDIKVPEIKINFPFTNKNKPEQEVQPAAIAANTASANSKALDQKNPTKLNESIQAPAPPQPVPLDVARILNRINVPPIPSKEKLALAPSLSASIPLAMAPKNIDCYIPSMKELPKAKLSDQQNIQSQFPTTTPSALHPKEQTNPLPVQSTILKNGAGLSVNSNQLSLPSMLPPVVQEALANVQPIIQPALRAADNLAQTIFQQGPISQPQNPGGFVPSPIPINNPYNDINNANSTNTADKKAKQLVEPESDSTQDILDARSKNSLPKAFSSMMPKIDTSTSISTNNVSKEEINSSNLSGARKLVDVKKAKSGAFSYMQPVLDSDNSFMLGAKQVRSIQALPGKPQVAKAAPPEDAVTRRMRYLLEYGTGNLKPGEAFMFSEETGEGLLFFPDGHSERRKLQAGQDSEQVLRTRRPDIVQPKDLQYTLSLLGKLLPQSQTQVSGQQNSHEQAVNGPTLDQLLNQNVGGAWGWIKNTFKF